MADTTHTSENTVARPRKSIKWGTVFDHTVLILGSLFMLVPILMVLQTVTTPDLETIKNGPGLTIGTELDDNFAKAMFQASGFSGENTGTSMLINSLILGVGFAVGKIVIGMMAAYAIVYFRLRFATFAFWLIFTTLLLPLEVRILPSYEIVQQLGMLNTYSGLIIPLVASATATFFFRQFFRSVPNELVEAARIDGAGPVKFFIDILVPLSQTMIAAMFIIMFVYGWNQYLWPTMITTDEDMYTLVRGIKQITQDLEGTNVPEYGRANMLALIAILPPVLIVIFFQSWFVKGLTESDK
ncbi:carbohydrate ABC transporter membrane protein 2, CUT1 family (TC 3.A.1.1.-) [Thalassococcus halodurans]|uniref:sn-glycerol-3-phosphate transport system permease protein UgpE n=1 Tax=Thalassococcus halodurans TaxID=373675 RepID=A0A1H6A768_9RHOB|nr:ABC transporter permease subunit [Thalassococcus halodurans]SEG44583.1 carbohydrate ABC transporter membrane protein 2, CUT1 family (TC 3.A.1.1.-) [Thalassococcus halodurans]